MSIVEWPRWQNSVDFVVLSVGLYFLLLWARQNRALRLALAIVGLHSAALAIRRFDLIITSWVLEGASLVAVVLLLVIFQRELRHAFMRLDSIFGFGLRPLTELRRSYRAVADTVFRFAHEHVGALVVVTRRDSVSELVEGGVILTASVSAELLRAIFRKGSPLHDGAVVIEEDRLSRAGVVLPLTQRNDVPSDYGTRHRAAMGLAERCDALVVAVSEERGEVTLLHGQTISLMESAESLLAALEEDQIVRRAGFVSRLRRMLLTNVPLKLAAAGLAAVFWALSFPGTGTTVRTVVVPVEFAGVSAGLEISSQSANRLEVQLRGHPWLMESLGLEDLVARFDLKDAGPGTRTLRVAEETLELPPGVTLERVSPRTVRLQLRLRSP